MSVIFHKKEYIGHIHIADLFPFDEDWKEGVENIVKVINKSAENFSVVFECIRSGDSLYDLKKYDESIERYDKA